MGEVLVTRRIDRKGLRADRGVRLDHRDRVDIADRVGARRQHFEIVRSVRFGHFGDTNGVRCVRRSGITEGDFPSIVWQFY